MHPVTAKRPRDRVQLMAQANTSRKERAARTRRSILQAARRLFSEHGYAGTTIEAIATEAGVAEQTVYYVFNTKAQLLSELFMLMAGRSDEPVVTSSREWVEESMTASDGRRTLALACESGTDISQRFAPIHPTVIAAMATEPDIADAWNLIMSARWDTIRAQMEVIAANGDLRSNLTAESAADISSTINSIETYRLLTEGRNWQRSQYKTWVYRTLCQLLLRPELAEQWDDPTILEGTSIAPES